MRKYFYLLSAILLIATIAFFNWCSKEGILDEEIKSLDMDLIKLQKEDGKNQKLNPALLQKELKEQRKQLEETSDKDHLNF